MFSMESDVGEQNFYWMRHYNVIVKHGTPLSNMARLTTPEICFSQSMSHKVLIRHVETGLLETSVCQIVASYP